MGYEEICYHTVERPLTTDRRRVVSIFHNYFAVRNARPNRVPNFICPPDSTHDTDCPQDMEISY